MVEMVTPPESFVKRNGEVLLPFSLDAPSPPFFLLDLAIA
jgi:hypothetical protein